MSALNIGVKKMRPKKLWEGIYWVGAEDWDRRLFDSLVPLPEGTSYTLIWLKVKDTPP